jgi:hypothetical protein
MLYVRHFVSGVVVSCAGFLRKRHLKLCRSSSNSEYKTRSSCSQLDIPWLLVLSLVATVASACGVAISIADSQIHALVAYGAQHSGYTGSDGTRACSSKHTLGYLCAYSVAYRTRILHSLMAKSHRHGHGPHHVISH